MAEWLNNQLKSYGVETSLRDLGKHVMDGQELPLPPAILGKLGNDPSKKTVLLYGHFDVQPVRRTNSLVTPRNRLTFM
jgi:Cys-Gly metallodipeptidase DUG1